MASIPKPEPPHQGPNGLFWSRIATANSAHHLRPLCFGEVIGHVSSLLVTFFRSRLTRGYRLRP